MVKKNTQNKKGFTIIELIVSIAVFTIIMTMSTGSILTVFDANRKSQSLRSVLDNLNLTLEAMTRTIRFGTTYHCDIAVGSTASPRDCASGGDSMSVISSGGGLTYYRLNASRIERTTDSGANWTYLTSSDVTITRMSFYVLGSAPYSGGDALQPRVVIAISGYVGPKPSTRTSFFLQTTVSQRNIDSQ